MGYVPLPVVIFVTAYDRYAVKAFDTHAVDSLLTPVSDAAAYRRARARDPPDVSELEARLDQRSEHDDYTSWCKTTPRSEWVVPTVGASCDKRTAVDSSAPFAHARRA